MFLFDILNDESDDDIIETLAQIQYFFQQQILVERYL